MRIAMVGPFGLRPKGTMSARALPLAKALRRRGHEVSLIIPPWQTPEESGRDYSEEGIRIINISLPPRLPLFWHPLVALRMVAAVRHQSPEIVHCFKPKAYSGLTAFSIYWLQKLLLTQMRVVVDEDDWEGKGGWNELGDYSWAQRHFFAWQERWGLRHADAVTVASRALQTIVWSLGVSPGRVYYLPNGWNPLPIQSGDATLIRTRYSLQRVPIILLYTRFLAYQPERIVRIMRRVLEVEPNAHLLVVGKGLGGEEEDFLRLLQRNELDHATTMAGWVPPHELPHYFAAADVAIYPMDDTLINRTRCSVKLIDLLAAGVPVIADRVGQNEEYIEHNVTGLLTRPGDDEDMAEKILALLSDEARRRALGENARRQTRGRYSWDVLARTAERAYQDILSRD